MIIGHCFFRPCAAAVQYLKYYPVSLGVSMRSKVGLFRSLFSYVFFIALLSGTVFAMGPAGSVRKDGVPVGRDVVADKKKVKVKAHRLAEPDKKPVFLLR